MIFHPKIELFFDANLSTERENPFDVYGFDEHSGPVIRVLKEPYWILKFDLQQMKQFHTLGD